MIRIEVTATTRTVKWADKKTGEQKSMTVQEAWAHVPGEKYPTKIEVISPKGEPPYAEAEYILAPESIVVQDGKLVVRPKLLTKSQAATRSPRTAAAG